MDTRTVILRREGEPDRDYEAPPCSQIVMPVFVGAPAGHVDDFRYWRGQEEERALELARFKATMRVDFYRKTRDVEAGKVVYVYDRSTGPG